MLDDKNIQRPWSASLLLRVVNNLKKIPAKILRKNKVKALNDAIKDRDFTIICQFCAGGGNIP